MERKRPPNYRRLYNLHSDNHKMCWNCSFFEMIDKGLNKRCNKYNIPLGKDLNTHVCDEWENEEWIKERFKE